MFLAGAFTGTPTETDEAIPMWFPLDALPFHEMWDDDHTWLPLLLAGKLFHGVVTVAEDNETTVTRDIHEVDSLPDDPYSSFNVS